MKTAVAILSLAATLSFAGPASASEFPLLEGMEWFGERPQESTNVPQGPERIPPPLTRDQYIPKHPTLAWARRTLECRGNPCIVTENFGGYIDEHDMAGRVLAAHKVTLAAAGECDSACARTVARLSAIGYGCIMPGALLGVHRQIDLDTGRSAYLSYGPLNRAIARRGTLPSHNDVMYIRFEMARRYLPVCGGHPARHRG
ncbi:hypothetical protein FJY94_03970 [Candidatus Kaiserbacteria bacterium]|nr:hypothetical protein [Candidatus Kaiserbacteria bacterium]